ncbi:MAG TPA: hypothetical protein VIF37_02130 [Methylobacter sp.]|jgi:hypothetical protein
MNQKIIAIALAFSLPLTAAAFPGDKCDSDGHRANRIERLTKSLGLTDEQKTKLEAIFKEQKDKSKIIHEETHTRMQQVLTKEQMTKMDEMKKQRHQKWQKQCETLKDQKTSEQMK